MSRSLCVPHLMYAVCVECLHSVQAPYVCTFQASRDSRVRFEVRSLGGRDVIRGEGCDSRGWCLQKKPRQ